MIEWLRGGYRTIIQMLPTSPDTVSGFDVGALVIGVVGGLALFLYGLEKLTVGLRRMAGGRLQTILARLTRNRFRAAFAGAFTTAVLQSSSVTTVLVVGFVSAGLMTLQQSIGIIMGANVGSTITAQIIAFRITRYTLLLVAAGFVLEAYGRKERARQIGMMVMGLGLLFFGMELMGSATLPLREYPPVVASMHGLTRPLPTILVGAGVTALIHSSAATTGVVIVLAGQGFVTLEGGILLVLGANIGTCVTALLAAIGKRREALRSAVVHVLFNVAGVLLWAGLVDHLADAVRWLSPAAPELSGMARLAAETPRQIANAHTLFNVVNTAVFIGLTGPIAWLVTRIVPDRPREGDGVVAPRYLDEALLHTPGLALDRIRMEIRRLGERAHDMVRHSLETVLTGSHEDLEALARRDDEIDVLRTAIVEYARRLSRQNLGAADARRLSVYVTASNHVESIGDMVETNLVRAGRDRLEHGLAPSVQTVKLLGRLHERVAWAVQMALEALDASSADMAQQVIDAKGELSGIADELDRHLGVRLSSEDHDRLQLFKLETDVTEYLRRVYYFAKRIARLVVGVNGGAGAGAVPDGDD
jgi:phosphate:Na+ symporter